MSGKDVRRIARALEAQGRIVIFITRALSTRFHHYDCGCVRVRETHPVHRTESEWLEEACPEHRHLRTGRKCAPALLA